LSDLAGLGIETLTLDVLSPEAIKHVMETISSQTGGSLDILVNNAGRPHMSPAVDVNVRDAMVTFDTNLFSVMRMCQAFSVMLIKAKGTILNIGSVAGVISYPYSGEIISLIIISRIQR
jgi:1-acylglycerone phosphate reductase